MMMSEFIARTGFEPTAEEYRAIEDVYYNFDGNKDQFCKDWLDKGGIMECCKARAEEIRKLHSKIVEIEREYRVDSDQQTRRIADLEARLDRELEWKPYVDEHNFPQDEYNKIRRAGGTRVLSDEEATARIAEEFGFAPDKIEIIREINVYEINRHRQLRRNGTAERLPLWNATDWQYIRFNVGCWQYEMARGELNKFFD